MNDDSLVVRSVVVELGLTDEACIVPLRSYDRSKQHHVQVGVLRPNRPSRRILELESNMYPLKKGKTTTQAHVGLPAGTFEEEHGRKGFYGKSAHLYRAHPPTGWIRFEGKLRPHCFD